MHKNRHTNTQGMPQGSQNVVKVVECTDVGSLPLDAYGLSVSQWRMIVGSSSSTPAHETSFLVYLHLWYAGLWFTHELYTAIVLRSEYGQNMRRKGLIKWGSVGSLRQKLKTCQHRSVAAGTFLRSTSASRFQLAAIWHFKCSWWLQEPRSRRVHGSSLLSCVCTGCFNKSTFYSASIGF